MVERDWENWEEAGYEALKGFMKYDDGHLDDSTNKIIEFISGVPVKLRKIIDIGCGPGLVAEALHNSFGTEFEYFGIDVTPSMIEVAKERCAKFKNTSFGVGDIFKLSSNFGYRYPVVICKGVLEHLPGEETDADLNYKSAIINLCSIASNYILLCIPELCDNEPLIQRIPSEFRNNEGLSYFVNFYNRDEIFDLLRSQGIESISEFSFGGRSFLILSKS